MTPVVRGVCPEHGPVLYELVTEKHMDVTHHCGWLVRQLGPDGGADPELLWVRNPGGDVTLVDGQQSPHFVHRLG